MSSVSQATASLIDLVERLQHKDGELEAYEGRRIYPSRQFAQDVRQLSSDLADGAVTFARAAPNQVELAQRLARTAGSVGETAGQLEDMARRQSTFGSGWGATLDDAVLVLNSALFALLDQAAPAIVPGVAAALSIAKNVDSERSAQKLVETNLVAAMKANPDDVKAANAVYQLTVTDIGGKDTKVWTIDCTGTGAVTAGAPSKNDCTMEISEKNLFAIVDGQLSPTSAVLQGKLKVSDVAAARRLAPLIQKADPNLN